MEPKKLILDHLKDVYVMQLATARNGQPWICNVHFYADDDLNLYWLSNVNTRHSQDIAANPRTAVAMAVHTEMPLVGVQLEGDAKQCDPAVHEAALRAYAKRHDREEWVQNIIDGKGDIKAYVFTPRLLSVFDFKTFPKDPKQEWPL